MARTKSRLQLAVLVGQPSLGTGASRTLPLVRRAYVSCHYLTYQTILLGGDTKRSSPCRQQSVQCGMPELAAKYVV